MIQSAPLPLVEVDLQNRVVGWKDGTLFDVSTAAAPVHDATGRLGSHVVVYTGVSAGRERVPSNSLLLEEERLRALIDSSSPAVPSRS